MKSSFEYFQMLRNGIFHISFSRATLLIPLTFRELIIPSAYKKLKLSNTKILINLLLCNVSSLSLVSFRR
jgi:hypothetical protein